MLESNSAKAAMDFQQVLSVSEFVAVLNQTLEFAYPEVVVEGEVSSFKISQQKWVHFDLKDDESTINCFMTIYQLKTPLEDGMKVRVTASPKLTKWGRFSLTVRSLELAGEGALQRAFALLKQKLEKEGLFEPARKRALPEIPARVGVVSSSAAYGYADFVEIINQRWGGLEVQLANVQVQGEPAPAQIVSAIEYFNQAAPLPDVLVIIRGGGSIEDLQAFNTELVVRAIASSRIPTLVGVGHELDVTLADMAADMRAATPTDAARRLVPNRTEFIRTLGHQQAQLQSQLRHILNAHQLSIQQASHRLERFLQLPKTRVKDLLNQLFLASDSLTGQTRSRLDSLVRILKNVDPRLVLRRGYAIARKGTTIVRSSSDVKVGDSLMIQLAKDQLGTEVKDVKTSR
jgi:exodeoxyribonuclease VII large subunit